MSVSKTTAVELFASRAFVGLEASTASLGTTIRLDFQDVNRNNPIVGILNDWYLNSYEIFKVKHFQQIIENGKLLTGGNNADPFIIARAKVLSATVITLEADRINGAKIPNICRHFNIPFNSLEGFMEIEEWEF